MTETQQPPRILVVDDEPAILKLVATLLERAGYATDTAPDGASALKRITHEKFDCLVTDAIMPEVSGYDLVRRIRQEPRFARLPILMLTRKRDREEVRDAVQAGVTDYVVKPVDEHLLLDKIGLCLKQGASPRHVHSTTLHGENSVSALRILGRILELGESSLTFSAPVPLTSPAPFQFKGGIFSEIGVTTPVLRLVSSERTDSPTPGARYRIQLSFSGLSDAELARIRRARYLYRLWHLASPGPRSPHILAVDDEPSILKFVRNQLERADFRPAVDTASSAEDALMMLQECHYDLLITDAMMPGTDGYELLRQVRSDPALAGLGVLLLTRKRNPEDVRRAVESGVSDYLVKPVDPRTLVDKAASALARFPRKPDESLLLSGPGGAIEEASFEIPIRIISISESGLKLHLPVEIDLDTPLDLRGRVFDEIGIEAPFFRLLQCHGRGAASNPDEAFEAELAFVGVSEPDLTKLRAWIHRHEIQRRK